MRGGGGLRRILSRLSASKSREKGGGEGPAEDGLVVQLQAGDAAAFEALVDRYGDKIYRLAAGITRNPADAEDVVQEVLLSVLQHIKEFEGRAALGTWIYRIAANAALMKLRVKPAAPLVPWEEELPQFRPDGGHQAPVADWSRDPEQSLIEKETRSVLHEALAALPPDYRTVVLLRDVEGLPAREAAEALDLSVAALKSRLHRARLFLRARVSGYMLEGHPPNSGGQA